MSKITLLAVSILFSTFLAIAAVERPDNIKATVSGSISFDKNTGLYTYTYLITNYGDSLKSVDEFYIPLRGANAVNIISPPGWEGSVNLAKTLIGWCACSDIGFILPPGYIADGRGTPSAYVVPPGHVRAGFSFQSPYPPSAGIFYLGAWIPVPREGVNFSEGENPSDVDFSSNLLSGVVQGPERNDSVTTGGRRPAVDGFLVFANLADNQSASSPLVVDILFAQNGETVNQDTFIVSLNNVDVTTKFLMIDTNRRRAVFDTAAGPLRIGRNQLTTTVEGQVPGSSRKATDTDRVVFLVR